MMRVLFAAVLLAMLLTPLVSRTTGAEGEIVIDPVILQDQPLVLDGTTPEPIPDVVQLEVDPGILDDPVLVDPANDVNDIFINSIYCPYDLDLYSVDYYNLAAGCNGLGHANGYELIVADSGAG